MFDTIFQQPKSQKITILLAAAGTILIPGLHKFYLGQRRWGIAYLLLAVFAPPIPRVASAIDAVWCLAQDSERFNQRFNPNAAVSAGMPADDGTAERVTALAAALRELDCLRQDGLLSECEFEQKRRQLIERLG